MSEQPREVVTEVSSSSEDEVDTDVDSNVNVVSDVNYVDIDVDIEKPDLKELKAYLDEVANEEGFDSGEV